VGWCSQKCERRGRQSRNNPFYRSPQWHSGIPIPRLLFLSVPGLGYNIFENEIFSVKYGNYTSAVYFRHPIPSSLSPIAGHFNRFRREEKHRPWSETLWFIDAPRSTRGPIITKVINNLRCLSGAWEYTSFDIPIVIRYYLRLPHRTGEQLTIVILRSIVIIIVGDQAQADVPRCARVNK